jgi:tRNA(Ile)-lysidine synthase
LAALPDTALTLAEFGKILDGLGDFSSETNIAVALSGGGDSMALTYLLSRWCSKRNVKLHAVTVNHGLRPEAAAEARQVAEWVSKWGLGAHKILRWAGPKPSTKIQEEARAARYRLMADYCHKNKIRYLFLAHHANDQVETILFRLAKGSGLDGLAGMSALQMHSPELTLVRPLLGVTHEQLLQVCKKAKTEWVEDKSNVSDQYARIRLRKSMPVLEQEGLSLSRIMTIGKRLERARKALEQVTDIALEKCLISRETKRIVLNYKELLGYPEEVILRIVMRSLQSFRIGKSYPPRLENVEALVTRLIAQDQSFKGATLGGCIIRLEAKQTHLVIKPEVA